jgi:phosphinothricin acetyltransferase
MPGAMTPRIRLAVENDAAAVASIYGPFCESTAVSFEFAPPSTEEIAKRIRSTTARFPWLVLEDDGVLAGYAYASSHRERAAYGWSVDTAVYVGPDHRRRGVGRGLYTTLFRLLRCQGYFKAYAGITLPNGASIALHEAMGFQLVGVYRGVGYKHGVWHDVAHYQVALQPERPDPDPPLPVSAVLESGGWTEALSLGLKQYRSEQGA